MKILIAHLILALSLQLDAGPVSFPSTDGGEVEGRVWGDGTEGLVLVHGGKYTWESWIPQAEAFAAQGFHVVAFNFRGRGESTGPLPKRLQKAAAEADRLGYLAPVAPRPHHRDVEGAIRFLRDQGCDRVSVVAGSIGGSAATLVGEDSAEPLMDRLVLLAPPNRTKVEQLRVPTLFVTTEGDRRDEITDLFNNTTAPRQLLVLEGGAHAQAIFATKEGNKLIQAIVSFCWSETEQIETNSRQ